MDLPSDFKHAQDFQQRLAELYTPAQVTQILRGLSSDSARSFWYNPLKPIEPIGEYAKVPGFTDLFVAPEEDQLTYSQAATDGHIYFQNASSLFAARLVEAQESDEILDLAAAPGGKTIAMAAAMRNGGRLAAVEPVKGRFHRLKSNVERCGVTNVQFYQRDGRGVGRATGPRFDAVLLDAPCSSESHMRWDDSSTYAQWSPRKVKECQRKQKGLIQSAYAALKPGGRLIYCTCSFSLEENEMVVTYLLERTDAQLLPIEKEQEHFLDGITQRGRKALPQSLKSTLRILPHGVWDGFYLAQVKKPG
ncbi:MAG: RsmB/NOP family class I SAM-dependent RNA methyltransferase [Pseudomonadota bacterium]